MAIFSRRTVQHMLFECAAFLTDSQLQHLTARLNQNDLKALDAEWELAVLFAFSKNGMVSHEMDLGGDSRLDLFFVPNADKSVSFAADVRTVSDDGYEKRSPVNDFYIEFRKRVKDITTGGFRLHIGAKRPKVGERAEALLPPKSEFATEIFNDNFKRFLKRIDTNPAKRTEFAVRNERTEVSLSYLPGRRVIVASGWPAYRVAERKDKNPIFNALKGKYKQLKGSGYTGPKGIVLCDGGSNLFDVPNRNSFRSFYSAGDAVVDFLRQHHSIDFVLLVSSIRLKNRDSFDGPTRKVQVQVFGNESYTQLSSDLRTCIEGLGAFFPQPSNTAGGARDTIKLGFDPKTFRPLTGGLKCSADEITVSASGILALLAGEITLEEYEHSLGLRKMSDKEQPTKTLFSTFLKRKLRIIEARVEPSPHDDSWLVFKFGPDPGISDFVAPKSLKKER